MILKIIQKSLLVISVILVSNVYAMDLVSHQTVMAKIVKVGKVTDSTGNVSLKITIENDKGELQTYNYGSMIEKIYYVNKTEKRSLFKISHQRKYYVEIGEYAPIDKKDETISMIYYIGQIPFEFDRFE